MRQSQLEEVRLYKMQRTLKKYSGKDSACGEGQGQIFCEEVREFINESRKCQTIYANFEGSHERIVKNDDLTQLDNLVFLTLSDGKERATMTPQEFAETDKLTKMIVKKISYSSMNFNMKKIRFQPVWIYYFDYLEKKMKSMPVFKIYKKHCGPEALYIDISVVQYESWDNFIMFSQFPVSFICVPRRGDYTFRSIDGDDLLDLEYICKNSGLRNKFQKSIRPLSQTLIKIVLEKVVPFARTMSDALDMCVTFVVRCGLHTHPQGSQFMGFMGVLGICCKIVELIGAGIESLKALESTAADCSLLLLNDSEGKPLSKWLISEPELVERPLQDKPFVACVKLFKNPRENLMEILKLLPPVMGICKLFCFALAGIREAGIYGADVSNYVRLLQLLCTLWSEGTGKNQTKEIGPGESKKWLCDVEKYASEKVFSHLKSSPGVRSGKEISSPPLDISNLQESGVDLFGFRVYLLLNHRVRDCAGFLQRLLKSNYTLQEGRFFQDIKRDGKLIGSVIPFSVGSHNHAVICLRLDKLAEVRN